MTQAIKDAAKRAERKAAPKSTRAMLAFHEPYAHTTAKTKGVLKYVATKDIHRIDAVYKEGSRAIIVCRGKDGPKYHATETAEELVAKMEGKD